MNMRKCLSVVMPCCNAGPWVDGAFVSVLTQRGVDLEVIAVDDGSTDETRAIIKHASRRDSRVRPILLDDNHGIVHALNAALDASEGTFIARMDADDISMPERFSRQIDFLQRTGCDLCGTWFYEFGQGIPRLVRWPYTEAALSAAMLFQNTICHPTLLARREVFDKYRYREEFRLVEDYDLLVRAGSAFRMANLPEALLRYRRHPSQATRAKRDVMEAVTQVIRHKALLSNGIGPTPEELVTHNLIRAPVSITDSACLERIEAWLVKLLSRFIDVGARQVVASQWVRACVRAAPLGPVMWDSFLRSPLCEDAKVDTATRLDLRVLALLKLDYRAMPFEFIRRFGLSV